MKQQLTYTDASLQTGSQTKQDLFNRFGGMLLGYISEVVKVKAEAENYLVDIFNQLNFADIQAITKPGVNTFIQLQLIARKTLAKFTATIDTCSDVETIKKGNKFVELMQPQQQHVFCGMHYHGKTTASLATELNTTEAAIRQLLKESFTIIRSNRK